MVNQWEAAEQQAEQCQSHEECQDVSVAEHVHAVLIDLVLASFHIVVCEVDTWESNGTHDAYEDVGQPYEDVAEEHVSLVVVLVGVVLYDGKGYCVEEVTDS